MKEVWDALDPRGNRLGYEIFRGDLFKEGVYHAVAEIAAIDEKGRLILTKRAPEKHFGRMWEITGGSVLAGETPEEGGSRELEEETGIRVPAASLQLLKGGFGTHTEGFPLHNALFYLYAAPFVLAEQTIRMREGETVDYRFLTKTEFLEFYRNGMIPTQKTRWEQSLPKLLAFLK